MPASAPLRSSPARSARRSRRSRRRRRGSSGSTTAAAGWPVGGRADLVLLDRDLRVRRTFVAGEPAWRGTRRRRKDEIGIGDHNRTAVQLRSRSYDVRAVVALRQAGGKDLSEGGCRGTRNGARAARLRDAALRHPRRHVAPREHPPLAALTQRPPSAASPTLGVRFVPIAVSGRQADRVNYRHRYPTANQAIASGRRVSARIQIGESDGRFGSSLSVGYHSR